MFFWEQKAQKRVEKEDMEKEIPHPLAMVLFEQDQGKNFLKQ